MATPWKIRRAIDLEKWERKAEHLGILAFTGAKNAHQLILTIFENDQPVTFASATSIRAYFMRSGEQVMIKGSVTANVITVKFPAAAYAIQTRVSVIICAENTDEKVPLYAAVFDPGNGSENVIVDPDDIIPDVSAVLAQGEAAQEAAAAANRAADAANEAAGRAPYIDEATGTWFIWNNDKGTYTDTGIVAAGKKGEPGDDAPIPYIGENGNWFVAGADTGTKAQGPAGQDGTGSGTVTGIEINGQTYSPDESGVIVLPELGGGDSDAAAENAVSEHNADGSSHDDIRQLIVGLTNRLNALADSDDTTLDQLSEIVAYIKSNKSLIDSITTGKVSTADIVDNLTTNVSSKVLSAAQGVVLKGLIDTAVSELKNEKVDKEGWTAGKNVVTDADGNITTEDKPTIPTALPNPNALKINGQTYDGSEAVEMTIEAESGAGIDDTNVSAETTYSSQKIESEFSALTPPMFIGQNTVMVTAGFPSEPTSSSNTIFTAPANGLFYLFANRGNESGCTLRLYILNPDGSTRAEFHFPAYTAYAICAITVPIAKGMKLKLDTDSSNTTWIVRKQQFFYNT